MIYQSEPRVWGKTDFILNPGSFCSLSAMFSDTQRHLKLEVPFLLQHCG